jgi:hypothetical protein
MSNLRALAIRTAATLPKGDSTRLKLIELAQKHAAGYSIGPGGLSPTKSGLYIQPNTVLYYGASSSPVEIIVTGVTDDAVRFIALDGRGGHGGEKREQRWIFEDLAISGSETWLKRRGKYFPEEARSIQNMLNGKPGKPINVSEYLDDQKPVTVDVLPTKPKNTYPRNDPWYGAEEYGGVGGRYSDDVSHKINMLFDKAKALEQEMPNSPEAQEAWNVAGEYQKNAPMTYEINTTKGALKQLRQDNRFKVVSVKSR